MREMCSLRSTEMGTRLTPSTGDSRLSPATVGVVGHRGRVLRQAWTLGRLRHNVEPCLPHRRTLPHSAAPLFLGALHASATAAVQSVHLVGTGNEQAHRVSASKHLGGIMHVRGQKPNGQSACVSVCRAHLNQNQCH